MDIDDIKYIKTVTKKRDRRGEYKRLKVHYCVYCGDEVTKENEFTRDTCNKRECKFKKLKLVLVCIMFAFIFSSCLDAPKYDLKLQREIFMECLKTVPQGPKRTVTNDWDEVISECRLTAWQLSRIQE